MSVVFLAAGRAVQILITPQSLALRLLGPDFQKVRRIRITAAGVRP